MIRVVNLRKADNEIDPQFELKYVDLERRKNEEGYFQEVKYDTESELRKFLKSVGLADAAINEYFEKAQA